MSTKRLSRLQVTFLLAFALVALIAVARRDTVEETVDADRFWITKRNWPAEFDMVVAGDSRTYRGVSPTVMKEKLPGLRIGNFGFSAVGLAGVYLDGVESKLDPKSKRRTIVLGVTPLSLTPASAAKNGYTKELDRSDLEVAAIERLGGLLWLVRPFFSAEEAQAMSRKDLDNRILENFYADGWVASRRVRDVEGASVRKYRVVFENNRVSPEIEEKLMKRISDWTQAGIKVFGFRPPVPAQTLAVEDELSGFDERKFVDGFSAAGGIWLDVASGEYSTYDGSHLREESARRLSASLAEQTLRAITQAWRGPTAHDD